MTWGKDAQIAQQLMQRLAGTRQQIEQYQRRQQSIASGAAAGETEYDPIAPRPD